MWFANIGSLEARVSLGRLNNMQIDTYAWDEAVCTTEALPNFVSMWETKVYGAQPICIIGFQLLS